MTPENIERVHDWLDSRYDWLTESKSRVILSQHWECLAGDLERAWEGEDAGIIAAMRGVLLDLVREAYGDPEIQPRTIIDQMSPASCWVIWSRRGLIRLAGGVRPSTEDDALISALEAAP